MLQLIDIYIYRSCALCASSMPFTPSFSTIIGLSDEFGEGWPHSSGVFPRKLSIGGFWTFRIPCPVAFSCQVGGPSRHHSTEYQPYVPSIMLRRSEAPPPGKCRLKPRRNSAKVGWDHNGFPQGLASRGVCTTARVDGIWGLHPLPRQTWKHVARSLETCWACCWLEGPFLNEMRSPPEHTYAISMVFPNRCKALSRGVKSRLFVWLAMGRNVAVQGVSVYIIY